MGAVIRAGSLREALLRMSRETMIPLAGGTDLMVRNRVPGGTRPSFVVPVIAIGHLSELRELKQGSGRLEVGAACTVAELLESPLVPEGWKLPLAGMGSPAIRNVATLGGNLGNASPAGDALPLLAALDAKVVLSSEGDERIMPVTSFITGPGKTCRRPDELIARFHIPLPCQPCRVWYRKVGTRQANCLSKVSLFACVEWSGNRIHRAGCALGAVAPTIVRSRPAEDRLRHLRSGEVAVCRQDMLALYAPLILPIDDVRASAAYRREVAMRLLDGWLGSLEEGSGS